MSEQIEISYQLEAEHCLDVIRSFQFLTSALENLKYYICEHDAALPAWSQAPDKLPTHTKDSPRNTAYNLISQLEYIDSQQPREILVGAGIISASQDTITAIEQLNQCKNNFKSAILNLKQAKIPSTSTLLQQKFESLLNTRPTNISKTLHRIGFARLHLKQCYRRIPTLKRRPKKVSWTWANTRSIKRIATKEAEQLLLKHSQDAGIEHQLRKLRQIPTNEHIAIVQDLAPHLRANIVTETKSGIQRSMVKGPVPLFYLNSDPQLPLPEFHPPSEKQGRNKNRAIRSDVKIEPEPFLPAIRGHRYTQT